MNTLVCQRTFPTPFSDLINLKNRPHRAAADRVGVLVGASRRQEPPEGVISTTWSLLPPRRLRLGCRLSRAASASYVVTTTCDPADIPWPTFGECLDFSHWDDRVNGAPINTCRWQECSGDVARMSEKHTKFLRCSLNIRSTDGSLRRAPFDFCHSRLKLLLRNVYGNERDFDSAYKTMLICLLYNRWIARENFFNFSRYRFK